MFPVGDSESHSFIEGLQSFVSSLRIELSDALKNAIARASYSKSLAQQQSQGCPELEGGKVPYVAVRSKRVQREYAIHVSGQVLL